MTIQKEVLDPAVLTTSNLPSTPPVANTGDSPAVGTSTSPARADHNHGAAGDLKTASGIVTVSGAAAPTPGQVLTALTATTATWQNGATNGPTPVITTTTDTATVIPNGSSYNMVIPLGSPKTVVQGLVTNPLAVLGSYAYVTVEFSYSTTSGLLLTATISDSASFSQSVSGSSFNTTSLVGNGSSTLYKGFAKLNGQPVGIQSASITGNTFVLTFKNYGTLQETLKARVDLIAL